MEGYNPLVELRGLEYPPASEVSAGLDTTGGSSRTRVNPPHASAPPSTTAPTPPALPPLHLHPQLSLNLQATIGGAAGTPLAASAGAPTSVSARSINGSGRPGMVREVGRRSLTSSPPDAAAGSVGTPPGDAALSDPPSVTRQVSSSSAATSSGRFAGPARQPAALLLSVQVDSDDAAPPDGAHAHASHALGDSGGRPASHSTPLATAASIGVAGGAAAVGGSAVGAASGAVAGPLHAEGPGSRGTSDGGGGGGQQQQGGTGSSSTPPAAADDVMPTSPTTGLSPAFNGAGIRTAFVQFFVALFKNYAR